MPTTEYPKNPNTDTAFVTDDNNHRTRAVKTIQMDGTIDYPSNPNSDSCYVTVDGKKQRALMVADISSAGTLDYPENSNSTKGYVTVNGKKQRVTLTASLVGGGSTPVIDELNVTPSTSAQTITAPEGTDGYSPVKVSAVTSAIDANIVAGNIKKDVSILGVTGSYKGVAPTGTKLITSNGIQDVAGYANADVQVPTTAPEIYRVFRVNNGKIENSISTPFIPLPSTATDISDYCYYNAYKNTPSSVLSGVIDLSPVTTISGISACYSMFGGCTGITSADLSSLRTLSSTNACGYMFDGCTGITSADLSGLIAITGSNACTHMFQGCTSLATVYIGSTTAIDFGTRTNLFASIFANCTQNIDVYAPAANQTKIETFSGYPNFGGTGTVTWHWRS